MGSLSVSPLPENPYKNPLPTSPLPSSPLPSSLLPSSPLPTAPLPYSPLPSSLAHPTSITLQNPYIAPLPASPLPTSSLPPSTSPLPSVPPSSSPPLTNAQYQPPANYSHFSFSSSYSSPPLSTSQYQPPSTSPYPYPPTSLSTSQYQPPSTSPYPPSIYQYPPQYPPPTSQYPPSTSQYPPSTSQYQPPANSPYSAFYSSYPPSSAPSYPPSSSPPYPPSAYPPPSYPPSYPPSTYIVPTPPTASSSSSTLSTSSYSPASTVVGAASLFSTAPSGIFFIASKLNDLVLDVDRATGSYVVTWPRKQANFTNQLWSMDADGFIKSLETQMVLEVEGDKNARAGCRVRVAYKKPMDHDTVGNQRWRYDATTMNITNWNGLCLDVDRASTVQGTSLVGWTPLPNKANQQFYLIPFSA
eukprot:Phypoly_transcript_06204.p1 GENE.Phypoly_transcript_06204~~Phypoly_transcript_06204.p1  ORF type:complete len:414 (+),score=147.46 Phypoly_transcript_06204:464-1705(+)